MRKLLSIFEGDSRSATVKKNIAGSLVLKGISIFTFFLIVPLTLNYVSSEIYGVWLTISSVIAWIGFFEAGLTLSLKNKLVEAIAVNDWDRAKNLVSTTYVLMAVIFMPLCIIIEPIIGYIDWASILNINASYQAEIILSMRLVFFALCLQMILHSITSICAAFQETALAGSFSVVGNLLSLIIIWIMTLTVKPSLVLLSVVMSFSPILVMIIGSFILYRTKYKSVKPNFKGNSLLYAKEIWGLGYKFFILRMQVVVMTSATNFLISFVSNPEKVTEFNIAHRYLAISIMFFDIIMSPLWPAFTDAFTKKEYDWMNRTYSQISRVCFVTICAILLMIPVSPYVYLIWIGDKPIIPIMMTLLVGLCYITQILQNQNILLINGVGCIKLQTYVAIFVSIVHFPLSIILGKFIGAYGVIVSLILMNIIIAFISKIQMTKILNQTASGIWAQ